MLKHKHFLSHPEYPITLYYVSSFYWFLLDDNKMTVKQRSDCTTFQWSCLTFWIKKNEFLIIAYQALWHQCPLHPHHHSQWITPTFLFVFLTLQNIWSCFHQRHLANSAFPFWCVFSCSLYLLLKLSVCSYHTLKVPFLETYSSWSLRLIMILP